MIQQTQQTQQTLKITNLCVKKEINQLNDGQKEVWQRKEKYNLIFQAHFRFPPIQNIQRFGQH